MNTDTPRTDAAVLEACQYYQPLYPSAKGKNQPVHAAFAREQELRITQLERELAEAKEAGALLQRHVNLARKVANCPDDETLVVAIEELQSQLTTQRAALEKAREVVRIAIDTAGRESAAHDRFFSDTLTTINAALEEKK